MDGLVSLMGRSMDNEESFHIDLLLASLSRMHPFVKQEDVERMVPVFEMARTVVEEGKDGIGELDVLAASFLLDYAQMLTGSERRVKSSKQQSFQDYKPYLDLVKLAFNRIKDYNTLPLLSTPTTVRLGSIRPCLSPGCLHIRKENQPDSLDFQIALSRVALDDTEGGCPVSRTRVGGRIFASYCFSCSSRKSRPNGPFTFQAVWMTAALVKSPDTVYDEFKDFPYSAVNRAYLTGDIPCDVFTFEKPFGKVDRILQLIPPASKNVAIKWRFGGYALYMAYRPCSRIPLLVETFWKGLCGRRSLKRFLLLSPNAPSDLVGFIGAGSRKGCLLERFGTGKA